MQLLIIYPLKLSNKKSKIIARIKLKIKFIVMNNQEVDLAHKYKVMLRIKSKLLKKIIITTAILIMLKSFMIILSMKEIVN